MDPGGAVANSDMEADEKRSKSRRRWWYAGASLALVLLLAGVAFLRVGSWLVVSDELAPSAAVVVLSGEVPFRAMEAGELYNEGWAPEVWLTEDRDPRREAAVAPLGVELFVGADDNRRILEAMGVPADAIHVMPGAMRNTADEDDPGLPDAPERGVRELLPFCRQERNQKCRLTLRIQVAAGCSGISCGFPF